MNQSFSDLQPTSTNTPPLPETRVGFLDVFGVNGPFLELSLVLSSICLTHNDPVLAALLLVCTQTWGMRQVVHKAMRETIQKHLRHDIDSIVGGMDGAAYIRLYEMYRSVHSRGVRPVLGDFLCMTDDRHIPTGFLDEYFDEEGSDDEGCSTSTIFSRRRTRQMQSTISSCLNGPGHLNELVVYGIFTSLDNRADALAIIKFIREKGVPGHNVSHMMFALYFSYRCDILVSLLKSFAIDDISGVIIPMENTDRRPWPPRLRGIQLTFDQNTLERLNAECRNQDYMSISEIEASTLCIYAERAAGPA